MFAPIPPEILHVLNMELHRLSVVRSCGPRMATTTLHILLNIFNNPGRTMKEIGRDTELSVNTISRNLKTLGDRHRDGTPGFRFIETRPDPHETRRFVSVMTPLGEQFVRAMFDPSVENPMAGLGLDVEEEDDLDPEAAAWMALAETPQGESPTP